MSTDKTTRQNRVREALGKLYDQHPPYFREYLRRFKEDPTSRVFAPLAEAYRRMGRVDEALDICREGLEHHPDFHGGRVALAKCYVDKKMYEEGRAELEKVVQAVPENLLAQRLLGDVYLALQRREQALHCFKMALLLSPSDVSLAEKVHNLEKSLRQGGDVGEAEPAVSISLEDPPAKTSFCPPGVAETKVMSPPAKAAASEWNLDAEEALEPAAAAGESADAEAPGEDTLLFSQPEEEELGNAEDQAKIDRLLGVDENDPEEAFKIEHVSAVFAEEKPEGKKEITTGTLGDLYFSQGQFDRALRIFEKLQSTRPSPELARKINSCRAKLGVDKQAILRNRQIHTLKTILKRVRSQPRPSR